MVQGQEDVGGGAARERGDVLDKLKFEVRLPDFIERGRMGPAEQL